MIIRNIAFSIVALANVSTAWNWFGLKSTATTAATTTVGPTTPDLFAGDEFFNTDDGESGWLDDDGSAESDAGRPVKTWWSMALPPTTECFEIPFFTGLTPVCNGTDRGVKIDYKHLKGSVMIKKLLSSGAGLFRSGQKSIIGFREIADLTASLPFLKHINFGELHRFADVGLKSDMRAQYSPKIGISGYNNLTAGRMYLKTFVKLEPITVAMRENSSEASFHVDVQILDNVWFVPIPRDYKHMNITLKTETKDCVGFNPMRYAQSPCLVSMHYNLEHAHGYGLYYNITPTSVKFGTTGIDEIKHFSGEIVHNEADMAIEVVMIDERTGDRIVLLKIPYIKFDNLFKKAITTWSNFQKWWNEKYDNAASMGDNILNNLSQMFSAKEFEAFWDEFSGDFVSLGKALKELVSSATVDPQWKMDNTTSLNFHELKRNIESVKRDTVKVLDETVSFLGQSGKTIRKVIDTTVQVSKDITDHVSKTGTGFLDAITSTFTKTMDVTKQVAKDGFKLKGNNWSFSFKVGAPKRNLPPNMHLASSPLFKKQYRTSHSGYRLGSPYAPRTNNRFFSPWAQRQFDMRRPHRRN